MSIQPNFIRVLNLKNNTIIYINKDKFDSMKTLLSEDCIYEYVYISPSSNVVYRTELFKKCI